MTYHVTARGLPSILLFRDAEDRDIAVRLLLEEVQRSRWTCVEYVVMSTHYHVVVELNEPTLSSGFRRLNAGYAQHFNRRYGRRGHVFEARFKSTVVESEEHRLEVARYVALNPTRANMCRLPQEYPWCGYGSIIGVFPVDPVLDLEAALAPFGGSPSAYRGFVEELDPRIRRGLTRVRPRVPEPAGR